MFLYLVKLIRIINGDKSCWTGAGEPLHGAYMSTKQGGNRLQSNQRGVGMKTFPGKPVFVGDDATPNAGDGKLWSSPEKVDTLQV